MLQVPKSEFDLVSNRLDEVIAELRDAYRMIEDVHQKYVSATSELNALALEIGPLRFGQNHYELLKKEHRLIELDFGAEPKSRSWLASPHMVRLIGRLQASSPSFRLLLKSFGEFTNKFVEIPIKQRGGDGGREPFWDNGWLPPLDGVSLYSFVAINQPKTYFEVGSGNSTKFVRKAIDDFGLDTRIVSVDPFPREDIDLICDEVHRVGFEALDLSLLDSLQGNDIVFIDNSHRSLPNSDVTVFFMDVIGRLPAGVLYGLHDIFLPYDYPADWAPRYYNEQYLLASYLFGGGDGDEIVLPCGFISREEDLISLLDPIWLHPKVRGINPEGGAFWMRRSCL